MPIGDGRIRNAAIDAATVGHPIVGAFAKTVVEAALTRAGLPLAAAAAGAHDIVANPPAKVATQAAEVARAVDSMPGGKPALASMTIQGAGVVILTSAAQVLELAGNGITADEWSPLLLALGAIVGGIVTVVGRIRARRPIGK